MNNFNFNNNILILNCANIKFDNEILDVIEINNIIIVLLFIPNDQDKFDNIYGLSDGKIIWQIQSVLDIYPNFQQMPYVGINEDQNNNLIVTDFGGSRFIVNPQNGKIIDRASTARW